VGVINIIVGSIIVIIGVVGCVIGNIIMLLSIGGAGIWSIKAVLLQALRALPIMHCCRGSMSNWWDGSDGIIVSFVFVIVCIGIYCWGYSVFASSLQGVIDATNGEILVPLSMAAFTFVVTSVMVVAMGIVRIHWKLYGVLYIGWSTIQG